MFGPPPFPQAARNSRIKTNRRRTIQNNYNVEHGITPKTIEKSVRDVLEISRKDIRDASGKKLSRKDKLALIERMTKEMKDAAKMLEFEYAAELRDKIAELKKGL